MNIKRTILRYGKWLAIGVIGTGLWQKYKIDRNDEIRPKEQGVLEYYRRGEDITTLHFRDDLKRYETGLPAPVSPIVATNRPTNQVDQGGTQ